MFSTDFIFRQQENFVDNQKYQAGFRPLCTVFPIVQKCPKNRSNAIYLQFKEKSLNFHKKRPFGRLRHKKGCLKAKERPYIHYLKH